jgi:hypothetical protein
MSTHRAVGRDELADARWIKSSRSGTGGGNCVEIAHLAGGHRAVRDSKNPTGPALIVTSAGWSAFTTGVRDSTFG